MLMLNKPNKPYKTYTCLPQLDKTWRCNMLCHDGTHIITTGPSMRATIAKATRQAQDKEKGNTR